MARAIAWAAWLVVGVSSFLFGVSADAAEGGEFQLFVENDTWSGTDRYYTNGLKLGLGGQVPFLREQAEAVLRGVAPAKGHQGNDDLAFGLFLGQNMYTPKNIRIAAPQPEDRPWAAWLYLGGVAQRLMGDRLDTVEIDLGVVGPAAGGRQVQTEWHKLVDAPRPMGWKNQIPNELTLSASYLQKRRIGSDSWDIVPHAGVVVGTPMTLARIGGIARVGAHMGGFGPDTIEPGGALLQNYRRQNGSADEWFAFVGVDHRWVAFNQFLDGNLFGGSPGVDRRPHVYDISVGFSARYGIFRFSLTSVRRSEEFHTSAGGGGRQRFHSINLGIELP